MIEPVQCAPWLQQHSVSHFFWDTLYFAFNFLLGHTVLWIQLFVGTPCTFFGTPCTLDSTFCWDTLYFFWDTLYFGFNSHLPYVTAVPRPSGHHLDVDREDGVRSEIWTLFLRITE